jgi:hypothetical protein
MDPHFSTPRTRHAPPHTLTDDELASALVALHRKRRFARRGLLLAHVAGASLTLVLLGAGFVLLLAGPAPFFERFLGREYVTTTYDIIAWWLVLLLLAILGGTFGDQLLRGKLRLLHHWRRRVQELERRIGDAEDVRRTRTSA